MVVVLIVVAAPYLTGSIKRKLGGIFIKMKLGPLFIIHDITGAEREMSGLDEKLYTKSQLPSRDAF